MTYFSWIGSAVIFFTSEFTPFIRFMSRDVDAVVLFFK